MEVYDEWDSLGLKDCQVGFQEVWERFHHNYPHLFMSLKAISSVPKSLPLCQPARATEGDRAYGLTC